MMSLPDSSHTASRTSGTPMTTVANGRYSCAEATTGEISKPKMPNTVRNPADMATVAKLALASATGRDDPALPSAIIRPR